MEHSRGRSSSGFYPLVSEFLVLYLSAAPGRNWPIGPLQYLSRSNIATLWSGPAWWGPPCVILMSVRWQQGFLNMSRQALMIDQHARKYLCIYHNKITDKLVLRVTQTYLTWLSYLHFWIYLLLHKVISYTDYLFIFVRALGKGKAFVSKFHLHLHMFRSQDVIHSAHTSLELFTVQILELGLCPHALYL